MGNAVSTQGFKNILSALTFNPRSHPFITVFISAFVGFIVYYTRNVAQKPILICKEGTYKSFLLEKCPIFHDRYNPTIWCFNTYGQTALANVFRAFVPDLQYEREILKLSDGGILALDWLEGISADILHHRPIILYLPGLAGHSQAEYIKCLVLISQNHGCRSVVLNNRGRGGIDILTPRTYCACDTEDLKEALIAIAAKYPDATIYAVGVSLGSIILGHYLAETKENSTISAAFFISSIFDIHASENSLSIPGPNLMMNRHLARKLCKIIEPYKDLFDEAGIHTEHVLKSETVRDFDERFTARIFNFESVDEYYEAASLKSKLEDIKVPLLCVNAADDIFCPLHSIPCDEIARTNNIAVMISARGGHIGFMDGMFPVNPFNTKEVGPLFSERIFDQFLIALISKNVDIKKNNFFSC